jgi:hypothetical protein
MTSALPLIAAGSTLLAIALGAWAMLKAWAGWLELRRLQLGARPRAQSGSELVELKRRVRKLETIALGIDP